MTLDTPDKENRWKTAKSRKQADESQTTIALMLTEKQERQNDDPRRDRTVLVPDAHLHKDPEAHDGQHLGDGPVGQ